MISSELEFYLRDFVSELFKHNSKDKIRVRQFVNDYVRKNELDYLNTEKQAIKISLEEGFSAKSFTIISSGEKLTESEINLAIEILNKSKK